MNLIEPISLTTLGITCLWLAYQDFKNREISLLAVGAFFLVNMAWLYTQLELQVMLAFAWKNLAVVAVILACITLFYSIKNKRITNIFDTVFGWGDVVFLVVLLPSMSPFNFLVFITVSNLLILLGFMVYLKLAKKNATSIPYAGSLSLLYYTFVLQVHIVG